MFKAVKAVKDFKQTKQQNKEQFFNQTMNFQVGSKKATFRFSGVRPKDYHFHMLMSNNVSSDNVLSFDSAMEEDILLTLYWFDLQRGRGPINAKYKIESGKLKLFIDKDDLRYMISFVALKKSRIMRPKRTLYVETEFPCLLHGLVYGKNDLFLLCYHRFCNLFYLRYFRRFQNQTRSMEKLEGIENFNPLYNYFQCMLRFFGDLLHRHQVEENEFLLDLDSPLTKSIATLCYCLNVSTQYNQQKNSISMVGLKKYRSFYTAAGLSLNTECSNFTCRWDQVLKLYELCFAQKNVYGLEVFKNTHFTNQLDNTNNTDGRKKSMVVASWNFGVAPLEETDTGRYRTRTLQQQYQYMKVKMESYAMEQDQYDIPLETKKLKVLLLVLDSLFLSKMSDSHLYKRKTKLFHILKSIVSAKRIRNMPLFVPTLPAEEHNRVEETSGGLNEYFSNSNWVFPLYAAKKMWVLDSQEWKKILEKKLKSNKHKI